MVLLKVFEEMFEELRRIARERRKAGEKWLQVVTHKVPLHLDEVAAYWVLWHQGGEKVFPGIRDAELLFRTDQGESEDPHSDLFEGHDWRWHAERGTLLIGTGGPGPFNEHLFDGGRERAEDLCTSVLVGEFLRQVLKSPEDKALAAIQRYVLANDEHGSSTMFDLAQQTRALGFDPNVPPCEALFLQMQELDSFYKDQQVFWDCEDEAGAVSREEIAIRGERRVLAVAESTNRNMGRFLFSDGGGRADVVVIANPDTKGVAILTRKKLNIPLHEVAGLMRWRESGLRGAKVKENELSKPGKVLGWYLAFEQGNALLNRAGTKIPLTEVVDLTKTALTTMR